MINNKNKTIIFMTLLIIIVLSILAQYSLAAPDYRFNRNLTFVTESGIVNASFLCLDSICVEDWLEVNTTRLNGLTTDNLTEGINNLYDNQSFNESLTNALYLPHTIPSGLNAQIQFNNNGSFGSSVNFTFNDVINLLTIVGNIVGESLNLSNRMRVISDDTIVSSPTMGAVNVNPLGFAAFTAQNDNVNSSITIGMLGSVLGDIIFPTQIDSDDEAMGITGTGGPIFILSQENESILFGTTPDIGLFNAIFTLEILGNGNMLLKGDLLLKDANKSISTQKIDNGSSMVFTSNDTLAEGGIPFVFVGKSGIGNVTILNFQQNGKNNSFSAGLDSYGRITNAYILNQSMGAIGISRLQFLSNLSNYTKYCEFLQGLGFLKRGCQHSADSIGRGVPLTFAGDLEVHRSIEVHENARFGGPVITSKSFTALMEGSDFDITNGSLHLLTPVNFFTGLLPGDLITNLLANFIVGLSPFSNDQTDIGNWDLIADALLCDSDFCAKGDGEGIGTVSMSANFNTVNTNDTNLSFVYSLVGLTGGNRFDVTIDNNNGSGPIQLFTDSGTETLISQNIILDEGYFNQSNLTLTFTCISNNVNRECYVDTVQVKGVFTENTSALILGFNSEICFGDGFRDIQGNCTRGIFYSAKEDTIFIRGPFNFTSGGGSDLSGSGTVNTIAKWSSSSSLTNSIMTDDGVDVSVLGGLIVTGGKVGFGTNTPTSALNVLSNTVDSTIYDSFVIFPSAPALRNDLDFDIGHTFSIPFPLTVTSLGRLYVAGNTQDHLIKIWNDQTQTIVASGTVLAASSSDANGYKFVSITPVVLSALNTYSLVVREFGAGDTWKDLHETVDFFSPFIHRTGGTFAQSVGIFPTNPVEGTKIFNTGAMKFTVPIEAQTSIDFDSNNRLRTFVNNDGTASLLLENSDKSINLFSPVAIGKGGAAQGRILDIAGETSITAPDLSLVLTDGNPVNAFEFRAGVSTLAGKNGIRTLSNQVVINAPGTLFLNLDDPGGTVDVRSDLFVTGGADFNRQGEEFKDFRVRGDNNVALIKTQASTDRVGIGAETPGLLLEVEDNSIDGNIFRLDDSDGQCDHNPESGSVIVSCTSDEREKKNIRSINDSLILSDLLARMNCMREYESIRSNDTLIGFSAQCLNKTHPHLVSTSFINVPNGTRTYFDNSTMRNVTEITYEELERLSVVMPNTNELLVATYRLWELHKKQKEQISGVKSLLFNEHLKVDSLCQWKLESTGVGCS